MKIKIENKDGRAQNTRVYSTGDGKEIDITNAGKFYNTKIEIPAHGEIEIRLIGLDKETKIPKSDLRKLEIFIEIFEGRETEVWIKKLEDLEGKNGKNKV